jgi:hypothetical protein
MNNKEKNTFYCYLLLVVFLSGQVIVFTHYHKNTTGCEVLSYKHAVGINHAHTSEIEKCLLCSGIADKPLFISEANNNIVYSVNPVSFSFKCIKKCAKAKKHIRSRAPPGTWC